MDHAENGVFVGGNAINSFYDQIVNTTAPTMAPAATPQYTNIASTWPS